MPMRRLGAVVIPIVLLAGLALASAQPQASPSPADAFTVQDVMIPMRDGVKLHTKIFAPKNAAGRCRS